MTTHPDNFDDLLAANREFATQFTGKGFDGIAQAGVALVTCMDSRIDPLGLLGLKAGDAKIIRNPGGRVNPNAVEGLVLAVHLLNVNRILIAPHTRCAMASATEEEFRVRVGTAAGLDASWLSLNVVDNQLETLKSDVQLLRAHPLIPDDVLVGGFIYDVDTGLLNPVA